MGVRFTHYAFDPDALTAWWRRVVGDQSVDSTFALRRVLDELTRAPEATATLRMISAGHRRWWLGSFLGGIRETRMGFVADDVALVETLAARLLRGFDCGVDLAPPSSSPAEPAFPLIPADEADLRMAVLDETEFGCLCLFLRDALARPELRFGAPPRAVGIAPTTPEGWDSWVRQAAGELAKADLSDLAHPALVSFIG